MNIFSIIKLLITSMLFSKCQANLIIKITVKIILLTAMNIIITYSLLSALPIPPGKVIKIEDNLVYIELDYPENLENRTMFLRKYNIDKGKIIFTKKLNDKSYIAQIIENDTIEIGDMTYLLPYKKPNEFIQAEKYYYWGNQSKAKRLLQQLSNNKEFENYSEYIEYLTYKNLVGRWYYTHEYDNYRRAIDGLFELIKKTKDVEISLDSGRYLYWAARGLYRYEDISKNSEEITKVQKKVIELLKQENNIGYILFLALENYTNYVYDTNNVRALQQSVQYIQTAEAIVPFSEILKSWFIDIFHEQNNDTYLIIAKDFFDKYQLINNSEQFSILWASSPVDLEKKETFYIDFINKYPEFEQSYFNLIDYYLEKANIDSAVFIIKNYLNEYPNGFLTPACFYYMGYIYSNKKKLDEAFDAYQKIISDYSPAYCQVHHNLGLIYYQKENYDSAIQEFEKDLTINFKNMHISTIEYLRIIYYIKKQVNLSLKCYLDVFEDSRIINRMEKGMLSSILTKFESSKWNSTEFYDFIDNYYPKEKANEILCKLITTTDENALPDLIFFYYCFNKQNKVAEEFVTNIIDKLIENKDYNKINNLLGWQSYSWSKESIKLIVNKLLIYYNEKKNIITPDIILRCLSYTCSLMNIFQYL